jgi:glucose uptake protein
MLGIFYALITVLAWGTWLAPSQNVPFKNQQIKLTTQTLHPILAVQVRE